MATEIQRVPLTESMVGIRLHAHKVEANQPSAAKVRWLLSLGAREQQRATDAAALQVCAKAVQQTLATVPQLVDQRLQEVAALAVELGLQVAREIVGAALDQGQYDPTPTVLRCLRDCVHGSRRDDLVVRLNPLDLELVQQGLTQHPELADEVQKARFVADRGVARGAVRAETDAGRLQYDPREALERVAAEVRREVAG